MFEVVIDVVGMVSSVTVVSTPENDKLLDYYQRRQSGNKQTKHLESKTTN